MITYHEIIATCNANPDEMFFVTFEEFGDVTYFAGHADTVAAYVQRSDVFIAFGKVEPEDVSAEDMHNMAVAHGEAYDEDAEYYDPMGYNTDAYIDYLNRN